MKLNIQKISLATVALGATLTVVAGAQEAPRLFLNGEPFRTQVAPIIEEGRVLVPLRDIFEGLGARVNYDDTDRSITAHRRGTTVHMQLGSRRAEINGQLVRLDVPADTVDGSTMVPLRFVSEALGANVNYNPDRDVVRINDRNSDMHNGWSHDGHRDDDHMHHGDNHDSHTNDDHFGNR